MTIEYQQIFKARGSTDDCAMQQLPRRQGPGFNHILDWVNLETISRVADIHSGGDCLQQHLPAAVEIDSFGPCNEFKSYQDGSPIDLENLDLEDDRYNLVVSLAAIHLESYYHTLGNAQGCLLIAHMRATIDTNKKPPAHRAGGCLFRSLAMTNNELRTPFATALRRLWRPKAVPSVQAFSHAPDSSN